MQRSIKLTEQLDRFVEEQIRNGGYHSPDEVVCEALRRMSEGDPEQARRHETLEHLIFEGVEELDAGMGIVIEGEDELERRFAELHERVDREIAAESRP